MIGALQEAVLSVSDMTHAAQFYREVGGWQVLHQGQIDDNQLAYWGLVPVSGGISADEIVLQNPAVDYGYLRLVQFHDIPQEHIRTGTQIWHTGGIYNLNLRVHDAADFARQMRAAGWIAYGDLHEYHFDPLIIREAMLHGADAIGITLVERVQPPLQGWTFERFSHVYNSLQVVRDYDAARAFYVDALGFVPVSEQPIAYDNPGDNLFGLPYNMAAEVTARLGIFKPPQADQSTLEILQLVGAYGADFSGKAQPPNLGIMLLRFAVDDLAALHERLVTAAPVAVDIHIPPADITIAPYGATRAMTLRSPDGAWLEFIE